MLVEASGADTIAAATAYADRGMEVVVVPDSTFYLSQEASGKQENLDSYIARSTPEDSPGFKQLEQLLPRFTARRYTTFDGVSTAIRVLQIAAKEPLRKAKWGSLF